MSFYPIAKVIQVRLFIEDALKQLGDQKEKYLNTRQEDHVCEILSLSKSTLGDDGLNLLLNFVMLLPSAEELTKIDERLFELAQTHHARIESMLLWDIVPKERHLFCTVARDDRLITVSLNWKNVEKGKEPPSHIPQQNDQWVRDHEAEGGLRFEIHRNEYHDMVAHFEEWLKNPLPSLLLAS